MRGCSGHDAHESHRATVRALARAYTAAILSGDEVAAERVIREALDVGLSTAEIDEDLMAPALWRVGELWERGELTIAEEHLATEITLRVLALQYELARTVRARRSSRVMLATCSGEQHVVALRMVRELLRAAGYETVMLGPDVPAWDLARAARRHRAEVICLSVTMLRPTDQVLADLDAIRAEWPRAAFLLGGSGLTGAVEARSQVRRCARVSEAVEMVDALIKHAEHN
jgi:methanogenic corrinoid protein MtbC1